MKDQSCVYTNSFQVYEFGKPQITEICVTTYTKPVRFPEVVLPFALLPKKCKNRPHVKDVILNIPLSYNIYFDP